MNEMLQRYLDGEIGLDALPPALKEEARRWDARLEAARAREPSGMPAGLEARVMRAVEREAERPGWARAWGWLVRPRPVAVSPLAALAGAAVVAALMLGTWWTAAPGGVGVEPTTARAPGQPASVEVFVEFALEAPGARSVAVAGDFTTWAPRVELQDPDGDGVWSGRVRVGPGVHEYMFVVDGSEWVTDPRAARWVDDGFGNRNAVLVVPGAVES